MIARASTGKPKRAEDAHLRPVSSFLEQGDRDMSFRIFWGGGLSNSATTSMKSAGDHARMLPAVGSPTHTHVESPLTRNFAVSEMARET